MLNAIYIVDPASGRLHPTSTILGDEHRVRRAEAITVSLLTLRIAEDYDGFFRKKNDLLVTSQSAFGRRPRLQNVHLYREDVPETLVVGDFYANTVIVNDDYDGREQLWLGFGVHEIDRLEDDDRTAAAAGFGQLASTAGAVFPVLVPFAFAADKVVSSVAKLVSRLSKNRKVLTAEILLETEPTAGPPLIGRRMLQAGTYVCVNEAHDPAELLFDGSLRTQAGTDPELSFLAFDIRRGNLPAPDYTLTQRIATLVTQLEAGNQSSPKVAIDFLRETMGEYDAFRKLRRYRELLDKPDKTDEEQALLERLGKLPALKGFI